MRNPTSTPRKSGTLDPTEAHIIANATRFHVTTPNTTPAHLRLHPDHRPIRKATFFTLEEACDYAQWLEDTDRTLYRRVLVYALEHDHPEAPTPSQQWRSVLVPKEHWI